MFTKLVAGITPSVDDGVLIGVIRAAAHPWDRSNPGGSFRIGITNELGQIYRTLAGDDLDEFVDTHEALTAAGLIDHFTVGETSIDGFDAILQRVSGPLAGAIVTSQSNSAPDANKAWQDGR